MRPPRSRFLTVVGFSFLALAGCDKLTYEHWEQIQVGRSSHYDVERALGYERHPGFQDLWHYERVDKHLNALIHFDPRGVVSRKEWHDTKRGIHIDTGGPAPSGQTPFRESTNVRTFDVERPDK